MRKSVGTEDKNRTEDIPLVQELLNAHAARLGPIDPLAIDGDCGGSTVKAITLFQETIVGAKKPDGRIDPGGATWKELRKVIGSIPKRDFTAPAWLKFASEEEGTAEKAGFDKNEERILEYLATVRSLGKIKYKKTSHLMSDIDETPWCACFVKWCVKRAGKTEGPGAQAQRWADYGAALPTGAPRVGAVTVVQRKPRAGDAAMTTSGYHVGFYIGGPAQFPVLLGGNQSNKVCRRQFVGWNILAYRWPT